MLRSLDLALLRVLRTYGHAPPVETAVTRFTRLGEHATMWLGLALLGLLVDRRSRHVHARAIRAIVLTYLLNIAAKYTIRRSRPLIEDLPALSPTVSSLSYPSAHAATSFAAARVLSERLPARPLYACAAAMALSRPYLGLHYPSDSLAGIALGAAVADLVP